MRFASNNWKHGCTASYQIEIHGQLASWIYNLYDNNHCWATMVSFKRVGDYSRRLSRSSSLSRFQRFLARYKEQETHANN